MAPSAEQLPEPFVAVINYVIRGRVRVGENREFTVVIERGEDGNYLASVPTLRGCHTHARSLDTLMKRVREAIKLYLEVSGQDDDPLEFVGIQRISL